MNLITVGRSWMLADGRELMATSSAWGNEEAGLCVRVGGARAEHAYLSSNVAGYVEIGQRIHNGRREVRVRAQDGSIYSKQSTPP